MCERTAEEQEGMAEAYSQWRERQDYVDSQAALPPHKQDGYAERVYEQADDERKRLKEEA